MPVKVSVWLALPLLLAACGSATQVPMENTARAPAAQGVVVANAGENGNTQLSVEVKHLAEPGAVASSATTYVVWVIPPRGAPQNVGVLRVDRDLTGRLRTLTPHPSFDVRVTAETFPTVNAPRGPEVLRAYVGQ